MSGAEPPARIEPLLIGRLTRILFGVATFAFTAAAGVDGLGLVGTGLLALLGASFVLGGITRNPGCESTALPNLFLPREKRFHHI